MAAGVGRGQGRYACLALDEGASGSDDEPPRDPSFQISSLLLTDERREVASDYSATISTATKASQGPLFSRVFRQKQQPIWDREESEKMVSAHRSGIWRISELSPTQVVTCSYDKTAKVWDMMRGHCEKTLSHSGAALCAAAQEGVAVTGSGAGDLRLWDSKTWTPQGDVIKDPNQQGIYSVAFLLGDRLATGATQRPDEWEPTRKWDHTIKIWNLRKREVIGRCVGHTGGVSKLIPERDHRLVSCSEDGTVRVWHTIQNKGLSVSRKEHRGRIYSMCRMGDNSLITVGQDQIVRRWDLESLTLSGSYADSLTKENKAHDATIFDVCKVSQNTFATASKDASIKIWDERQKGPVRVLNPDDGFVYSVCALSEQFLVAGTQGRDHSQKKREPNLVSWVFPKESSGKVDAAQVES